MKSQIKLDKDELSEFYEFLKEQGFEINTEVVDWRVLMWRAPDEKQWTQAYDGRTRSGKNERDFLRVFGPDAEIVEFFNQRKES